MANSTDLNKLFSNLKRPNQNDDQKTFSVVSMPYHDKVKLGKDCNDNPCMLIPTEKHLDKEELPPIVLEYISIEFNLLCRVYLTDGNIIDGRFALVQCRHKDKAFIQYFLGILSSAINLLSESPTEFEIRQMVDILVQLFKPLNQPAKKSVQGLWAELFLIAKSKNPQILLNAWHSSPEEKYDFSDGRLRIEVKSSSQRIRKHHFSIEQLTPPPDSILLIASLFVERAGGGTAIKGLTEKISEKIKTEPILLLKIEKIINETLGENWENASIEKFDYELAGHSLIFTRSEDVPSINPVLPIGVSQVSFISDLSNIPSIDIAYYRNLGELFKAIL